MLILADEGRAKKKEGQADERATGVRRDVYASTQQLC